MPANISNATLPSNCVTGNTGPLCGLCVPGYALQSGQCLPCDPKDAFDNWSVGSRTALLVLCIAAGFLAVAFLLFQPIVPSLERANAAFWASLSAAWARIFDCCCCCLRRSVEVTKPAGESEPEKGSRAERYPADVTMAAAEHHAHAPGHKTELQEARQEAVAHGMNAAIASGLGNAVALGMELNEDEMEEGVADAMLEGFDGLEELMEQAQRIAKILVNFYQARDKYSTAERLRLTSARTDRFHIHQVAGHSLALRLHRHHEQGEHRKFESSSAAGRRLPQSQPVLLQAVQRHG
jgi:hypothetical protein